MGFPIVNGLRGIEFGTPGVFRDELNALVLSSKKQATAGTLEWDYLAEGEPVETVGERLAVLNNVGEQIAIIEATKITVTKFSDVPDGGQPFSRETGSCLNQVSSVSTMMASH